MCGLDEARKQRMRPQRLRFELRMELDREVPRVARQLDDLDELAVDRAADDPQPLFGERLFVETVELVPMPVPLVDDFLAVQLERQGIRREPARVTAEPHRAAHVVDPEQVAKLVDDLVGRVLGDFG